MKKHLIQKLIVLGIFALSSIIIEIGTFLMEFDLLPKYFIYNISILFFIFAILMLVGSLKWQIIISSIILLVHCIIGFANLNLLVATGEIFSWDMLSLIPEGKKVLGGSTITNYTCLLFYIPIFIFSVAAMIYYYCKTTTKNKEEEKANIRSYNFKFRIISLLSCIIIALSINFVQSQVLDISALNATYITQDDKFLFNTLYSKQEAYRKFGTYGYYVQDAKKMLTDKKNDAKEIVELSEYVSNNENTDNIFTGVSEGNNLIFILFETWEWSAINKDLTPNLYNLLTGYEKKDGTKLNESLLLTNYHAKSQTNISEAQMIFGSYSIKGILNFNYQENEYLFILLNMFRSKTPNAQITSFHNNYGTYYDRNNSHVHFGFDEHVDAIDMGIDFSETTLWINMDQEIFKKSLTSSPEYANCTPIVPNSSVLNPKPFFSFISTFATHGPYLPEREEYVKLGYYDIVDEYARNHNYEYTTLHGDTISFKDENIGEYMRTYMAAAMDFDYGFGLLLDDLEQKNLLEDTTIVLMADHYTYYHNVSVLSKGYEIGQDYIPDIYNVPAMIFDTKLVDKIKNEMNDDQTFLLNNNKFYYQEYQNDQILSYDKFCANIDMSSTLFNMLNIPYNEKYYLGYDIFGPNQSFIISRWGNFFNDIICTSDGYNPINFPEKYYEYAELEEKGEEIIFDENILSEAEYENLKAQLEIFREKASDFLERSVMIDMMYQNNYFYNIKNLNKYYE